MSSPPFESAALFVSRRTAVFVSQVVSSVLFLAIFGSYFWMPAGPTEHVLDVVLRTYLLFLGGVMVHEASHGHLGNSSRSNAFFGRLVFVAMTELPYSIFRRTHLLHHAHTNSLEDDPDAFLNSKHKWQIPFRALAMPYHWVWWLHRRGKLERSDGREYLAASIVHFGLYGVVVWFVGLERVLTGALPALVLQPLLLWYFFAYRTHEGYSTADAASRSHNYYGLHAYWFSLGLSMHRVHHMTPKLAWLQMLSRVPRGALANWFTLGRDIHSRISSR